MKLAAKTGDTIMLDEIVETLPKDGVPLTPLMVHYLLEGMNSNHEQERAIMLFRDVIKRGVKVRLRTWNFIISMCVENREPEEAFRILLDLKDKHGEGSVSEHTWWIVLDACSKAAFVLPTSTILT